jgi:hypothetical protein
LSALNARSSVADSVGYTTTAAQRNTISSGGRRHKVCLWVSGNNSTHSPLIEQDTMIDSAHASVQVLLTVSNIADILPPQNLDSSVYELNAGKTLSQSDGGEYGVTVTKVCI